MHVGVNMTNKNVFIFDSSDLHIQENLKPDNIEFILKSATSDGGIITIPPSFKDPNTLHIDFDKSDLRIDEDLISNNIRVYFGDEDSIQPKCDNFWKDVDGDNVSIDCNCLTLWEEKEGDSTDLVLDCDGDGGEVSTSILGQFKTSVGEIVSYDIHGLEIYNTNVGEVLTGDIYTNRTLIDNIVVVDGSELYAQLYKDQELSFQAYAGENSTTNILLSSIANLDPIVNVGENLEFVLNQYVVFSDLGIDIGEIANVNLLTSESANIGLNVFAGETVYTSISFIPTIVPNSMQVGENLDSLFTTYSYYRLNPDSMQVGENLEPFKLTGVLYANPLVDVGEDVDVNVEFDSYQGIPITVDTSGESLEFNLFRNRLMYPDVIEVGEYVTANIQDYTAAKFISTTTTGETLNINLSADVYIGTFNAIDGQSMFKPTLYSLENYVVSTGENVDVSFAVDATIPVNVNSGELLSFDFKRGEPASLPFTVISGESMNIGVRSLRSVDFSVSFTVGNRVYIEDWINEPFSIDLDDRRCCDKVASSGLLRVELDDAPYNSTRYDATISMCEVMTFDLSVRRALEFSSTGGESLDYDTNINEMRFECFDGQYAIVPSLRTISTVDLEDGNTIPENPIIDVNRPDIPNNFNYIGIYSGEAMSLNLSYTQSVKMSIGVGETFASDIVTNPPFYFGVYAGEYMYSSLRTDIKFKGSFEIGEMATSAFYEPDYNGASGEELHFELDTKDDYYAEFTIDGCLDNKYADIDPESGQPLPNEYNGTSVEGEMFSAYVTGRCF